VNVDWNQSLESLTLPTSLQSLSLAHYDKSIKGVTFPNNLCSLTIGSGFNQSLNGVSF
jgi:hypothetical protein